MGTRHLIIARVDNKNKIAQYGQWDGDPGGQGASILSFLINSDLDLFKNIISELEFLTQEEMEALDKEENVFDKHPYLSRDTGSAILDYVYDGTATKLVDSTSFASDSVFCEWAYVIDFDKRTFEIYKGFNKEPLTKEDRFFVEETSANGYHPVKLFKSYSLEDLPTSKEFHEFFYPEELEEGSNQEANIVEVVREPIKEKRNLSGVFFKFKNPDSGQWEKRTFEDIPAEEQMEILNSKDQRFVKELCQILAKKLRDIGDQLDIITE